MRKDVIVMTVCMEESKKILEELSKPFLPNDIEWRVQSVVQGQNGQRVLVLPYITSRAVLNRLDHVCGGFWQSSFEKITVGNSEAFQCSISIKIGDEWILRTDAAEVSDIESVKGGHSNALKRAGVQWGIGRYLYDLPQYWVPVKDRGQHYFGGNFKVKGSNTYVKGYFDAPELPNKVLPHGVVQTTASQPSHDKAPQKPAPVTKPSQQRPEQKPNERQGSPIDFVIAFLRYLNVPAAFVGPLLHKSSGCTVPLEQASVEDLRKLHKVLSPVKNYVFHCREYGLDEERMLYYAQIILKEQLENIYSLFFKLDKPKSEQILELIREDLNISNQIG